MIPLFGLMMMAPAPRAPAQSTWRCPDPGGELQRPQVNLINCQTRKPLARMTTDANVGSRAATSAFPVSSARAHPWRVGAGSALPFRPSLANTPLTTTSD